MSKLALVVDDSVLVCRMLRSMLEKGGFEVVQAADGEKALAEADKQSFALVITDMNMPVMNGLELITELRKRPSHRFTPIVFLTTETNPIVQADARKAGATGWIQKPFDSAKVMSVVDRIFAG